MAKISINSDSLKQKRDIVRHRINPGDNVFRILPPFGSTANGYPYRRWTIAWLSDPESGRRRPYASPFSFGEDSCPVYEYCKIIEKKKEDETARITAKLSEKGMAEQEIKDFLKKKLEGYTNVLWNLKPKSTFFYNAVNKTGEVGVLEIKTTAHNFVKKIFAQYIKDYNQDPTSLNSDIDDSGVWIIVNKQGAGNDTEYTASKRQIKLKDPATGRVSFGDDQEALPENVVENYADLGYDLNTLYKKISYNELKQILIVNLHPICEQYPELIIPGFMMEDLDAPRPIPAQIPMQVPPEQPAKKVGTKPITLKVDADEDIEDELVREVVKPKPTPKPVVKPVEVDIDDEVIYAPVPKAVAKKVVEEKDDPLAYAEALLNG